jgi:hypothetical protein
VTLVGNIDRGILNTIVGKETVVAGTMAYGNDFEATLFEV